MPENEISETISYKASEAAKIIGVHRRTVTRWVREGVLPGRIIAGTCLVYRGAVDRMRAEADAA